MAISRKSVLVFLSGSIIAGYFIAKLFAYPTDVLVTRVNLSTNKETGVSTITFRLVNATPRLQRPVILITLRNERDKKYARDPWPLYANEMTISLFAREEREIRHDITLATRQKVIFLEVRLKRWFDF
jgi:hypothetical protein